MFLVCAFALQILAAWSPVFFPLWFFVMPLTAQCSFRKHNKIVPEYLYFRNSEYIDCRTARLLACFNAHCKYMSNLQISAATYILICTFTNRRISERSNHSSKHIVVQYHTHILLKKLHKWAGSYII